MFSPQAWGCTVPLVGDTVARHVFPTGVGVYRERHSGSTGDVQFSPQAWGCTVILTNSTGIRESFPHRRGGVPGGAV